jgi:SAM-dependent methyltransferase
MKNQKEIENWNGAIGERWSLYQESLDPQLRAYGEQVLAKAALGEGLRVLDVGAGCGDMTLEAARIVGSTGQVVGVDISRPMLGRARERAKGLANVAFLEHDASTFSPEQPFDRLISRFGVMFFDDPAGAFANLHRATKPGGALTFVCWQSLADNPWASLSLSAVLGVLGAPPAAAAPDAPGPFAFADTERVGGILAGARWKDVTFTPFTHPMKLGTSLDDALEYTTRMGPAARLLRDVNDDATRERATEALRAVLEPFAPDFALGSATWIVSAKA